MFGALCNPPPPLQQEERARNAADEDDDDDDEDYGSGKKQKKGGGRGGVINGALAGGTYTLVCGSSLVGSASCLVAALDKAVAETEALLLLRDKQRTAAADVWKRRRNANADGHISSDDEDGHGGHTGNGGRRLQRLQGIDGVDETVYGTVKRLFEAALRLLLPNIGDATERVVGLFAKLYRLLARLTKVPLSRPLYNPYLDPF